MKKTKLISTLTIGLVGGGVLSCLPYNINCTTNSHSNPLALNNSLNEADTWNGVMWFNSNQKIQFNSSNSSSASLGSMSLSFGSFKIGLGFNVKSFVNWIIDKDLGYDKFFSFATLFNHYVVSNENLQYVVQFTSDATESDVCYTNENPYYLVCHQPIKSFGWSQPNTDYTYNFNASKNGTSWGSKIYDPIFPNSNWIYDHSSWSSWSVQANIFSTPLYSGSTNLFDSIRLCIHPNPNNPSIPYMEGHFDMSDHMPLPPGQLPTIGIKMKVNGNLESYINHIDSRMDPARWTTPNPSNDDTMEYTNSFYIDSNQIINTPQ